MKDVFIIVSERYNKPNVVVIHHVGIQAQLKTSLRSTFLHFITTVKNVKYLQHDNVKCVVKISRFLVITNFIKIFLPDSLFYYIHYKNTFRLSR
jgi:hypothetical protein